MVTAAATAPPSPRFVVIGAAKAATTWLASQLRARDDVFLPGPEPHYFSREYARGPAWYAAWFASAPPGALVGEKSADYLADPAVPARLARDLPDARLIAILRSPIDRAYSDYCMWFRRGDVGRDVATYLDRARTPLPRFLDDGLYGAHLARWLAHVPADRLDILVHEDVSAAPAAALRRVAGFLNLPQRPAATIDARVNDSRTPLLPQALRRLPAPLKRAVQPFRGTRAFGAVRGAFARPVAYPPLDPDLRARLADFYADDVYRLSRLIGRDLGSWLDAPAVAA